jgi:hypothetical protein
MADLISITKKQMQSRALKFVLLIGVVSFFADFTYEGARSVTGPYLAILGASATLVGFIAGLGELLGYGLRLVSGRLSERTGEFWPITIFGYIVQMSAVPLLALAPNWQIAGLLIVVERIGKAIRNGCTRIHHSSCGRDYGAATAPAFRVRALYRGLWSVLVHRQRDYGEALRRFHLSTNHLFGCRSNSCNSGIHDCKKATRHFTQLSR